MSAAKRKVVLGLGNMLFRDEGFGIQALQSAQELLESRYDVDWVDGGVLGLNLLPLIEDCSHLLVLDAVDTGQPGGNLVVLVGDEIPMYAGLKLSEHQIGFQEVLALAQLRGNFPASISLVGVQPADVTTGVALSPEVRDALPAATQEVEHILHSWQSEQ